MIKTELIQTIIIWVTVISVVSVFIYLDLERIKIEKAELQTLIDSNMNYILSLNGLSEDDKISDDCWSKLTVTEYGFNRISVGACPNFNDTSVYSLQQDQLIGSIVFSNDTNKPSDFHQDQLTDEKISNDTVQTKYSQIQK